MIMYACVVICLVIFMIIAQIFQTCIASKGSYLKSASKCFAKVSQIQNSTHDLYKVKQSLVELILSA